MSYPYQMAAIWAVSDFLESHGRDTPLWLRVPYLCAQQLAQALEAGVQTLSFFPEALAEAQAKALLERAQCAAVECVEEYAWPTPMPPSRSVRENTVLCIRAEQLPAPECFKKRPVRSVVLDLDATAFDTLSYLPKSVGALCWEHLPQDDAEAVTLLGQLRGLFC